MQKKSLNSLDVATAWNLPSILEAPSSLTFCDSEELLNEVPPWMCRLRLAPSVRKGSWKYTKTEFLTKAIKQVIVCALCHFLLAKATYYHLKCANSCFCYWPHIWLGRWTPMTRLSSVQAEIYTWNGIPRVFPSMHKPEFWSNPQGPLSWTQGGIC